MTVALLSERKGGGRCCERTGRQRQNVYSFIGAAWRSTVEEVSDLLGLRIPPLSIDCLHRKRLYRTISRQCCHGVTADLGLCSSNCRSQIHARCAYLTDLHRRYCYDCCHVCKCPATAATPASLERNWDFTCSESTPAWMVGVASSARM
jgi:hypothetical protein